MKAHLNKRRANSGVSLLEVMVVLAIFALIVSLTAPRVMENFGRAKSQATEIKMTFLTNSLQLFYIDVGRYPTEAEGLSALSENPGTLLGWSGPYIDSLEDISDPWGRDFLYTSPAENKPFEIKTLGRDGIEGGEGEDADVHL